MINIRKSIFLVLLFLSIYSSANAQMKKEIQEEFISGKLEIDLSIFNSYTLGHDKLKKLLDEEKWEDLAQAAYDKKFPSDIYYYLIGKSAEGLGYKEAAIKYYTTAKNGKYKCKQYMFGDACLGFDIPTESEVRLIKLKQTLETQALKSKQTDSAENEIFNYSKENVPGLTSSANGPKGLGWLKIDTSIGEIKKDIEIDGVRLTTDLAPTKDKIYEARIQAVVMQAEISTPFISTPTVTNLVFRKNKLQDIFYSLGRSAAGTNRLQAIKLTLIENYGNPVMSAEGMTSIECSYKNGAKFSYDLGDNKYSWYSHYKDDLYIKTTLTDSASFSGCPVSLKEDVTFHHRSSLLSISIVSIDSGPNKTFTNMKKIF